MIDFRQHIPCGWWHVVEWREWSVGVPWAFSISSRQIQWVCTSLPCLSGGFRCPWLVDFRVKSWRTCIRSCSGSSGVAGAGPGGLSRGDLLSGIRTQPHTFRLTLPGSGRRLWLQSHASWHVRFRAGCMGVVVVCFGRFCWEPCPIAQPATLFGRLRKHSSESCPGVREFDRQLPGSKPLPNCVPAYQAGLLSSIVCFRGSRPVERSDPCVRPRCLSNAPKCTLFWRHPRVARWDEYRPPFRRHAFQSIKRDVAPLQMLQYIEYDEPW